MTPHPNQILSKFREGLDTFDIAKLFKIPESQVVELLHEARKKGFVVNVSKKSSERGQRRGVIAMQLSRKKAVTLPTLSFLGGDK
jgi:hypothetical protein